jgi:hypothetical protein
VFISYARSDASAFAEDLLQGLEVAGFEPLLDRHDIAAGEDWEARLGALIQAADTVVFVVSPAAAQSERCAWEVARAEALSKRIIPVVAIDVPESDTPKGLSRRNYIFFGADRSFVRALAELAAALKTDIDWIREHTRLGELAARWSERNRAEALLLRGSELDAAKAWLAGWQAPAPAPTEAHRAFIGESEAAEHERLGAERLRLEEITQAQAERERALKRLRRGTLVAGALVGALFLATAAGGVALFQANERLGRVSASLSERNGALSAAQAELERVAAALGEARVAVVSSEMARETQSEELTQLRERLARTGTLLARTETEELPDFGRARPAAPGDTASDLAFAAGYSSAEEFLFDGSVTERNRRGREAGLPRLGRESAAPECRQDTRGRDRNGLTVEEQVTVCRNGAGEWVEVLDISGM